MFYKLRLTTSKIAVIFSTISDEIDVIFLNGYDENSIKIKLKALLRNRHNQVSY